MCGRNDGMEFCKFSYACLFMNFQLDWNYNVITLIISLPFVQSDNHSGWLHQRHKPVAQPTCSLPLMGHWFHVLSRSAADSHLEGFSTSIPSQNRNAGVCGWTLTQWRSRLPTYFHRTGSPQQHHQPLNPFQQQRQSTQHYVHRRATIAL